VKLTHISDKFAQTVSIEKDNSQQEINEGTEPQVNFTADQINKLAAIRDLPTLKARAKAMIGTNSKRPMKPEKIEYFKDRIDQGTSATGIIKLMYDLLLSGEGLRTIGSKYSTKRNSYRRRFGESSHSSTAYKEGEADGMRGYRNPRASEIYGPDIDDYNSGVTAGQAQERQAAHQRHIKYSNDIAPFLKMSDDELASIEKDILARREEIVAAFDNNQGSSALTQEYQDLGAKYQMINQAKYKKKSWRGVEENKEADLTKISSDKLYKFIQIHKNAGNTAAAERGRKELERRGIKTEDNKIVTEAKGNAIVRVLTDDFNKEISGEIYFPLDYKSPGTRVWTRGDGRKYRDPGSIFINKDMNPADKVKWNGEKPLEKFWDFLKARGATEIKEVSGEFGSDPFAPALKLNRLIFVNEGYAIRWGSISRLRNSSVWRQHANEGYRVLPNIDREKYVERDGLEGPFRARNGKVYYYDPKAGQAYDPDTDMYIDYDDLRMMDESIEPTGILAKIKRLGVNVKRAQARRSNSGLVIHGVNVRDDQIGYVKEKMQSMFPGKTVNVSANKIIVNDEQAIAEGLSEMDNRTPSSDRREQRANSPEAKAKRHKEEQESLRQISPAMRKKLRLPEPEANLKEVSEQQAESNPVDTVTVDIPLFIRMLEFAREDAASDEDLHAVTDKMIELSQTGDTLKMKDYNAIVSSASAPKAAQPGTPEAEPDREMKSVTESKKRAPKK
jgi:hypothetical protein